MLTDRARATGRAVVCTLLLGSSLALAGCGGDDVTSGPEPMPVADDPGQRALPSVLRIETTDCDGGSATGSGFLLAPDLVLTNAHVVADANTVSLRALEKTTRGVVEQVDPGNDLALVRLVHAMGAAPLELADIAPQVGDVVSALGSPSGRPVSAVTSEITGTDARVELADSSMTGMLQLSAATGPGASGGPIVDVDGRVAGMLTAGTSDSTSTAFAVPADRVGPTVDSWREQGEGYDHDPGCPFPWADLVTIESEHPDAPALAWTFDRYFRGINTSDYDTAFGVLTGEQRGVYGDVTQFAAKQSSSRISDVVIEDAERAAPNADRVDVRFRSEQSADLGFDGQTCSDWHLRYRMLVDSGAWLIESATRLEDDVPTDCS